MDDKSLKKDRYDILIDLIKYGITRYGGVREHSFAGEYDFVYNVPFYIKKDKQITDKKENFETEKIENIANSLTI